MSTASDMFRTTSQPAIKSVARLRSIGTIMGEPAHRARHAFAPLNSSGGTHETLPTLKGVIFDMDGTLCKPQNHMFKEMRSAVGIPKESDILDYIHDLPDQQQQEAFAKIQDIERRAMAEQVPQAGLVSLLEALDKRRIRKGICTRNFDAPVSHLLATHVPDHINPFSPVVTRDFRPPKPSPAGLLHIAQAWGLVESANVPDKPPAERLLPLLMVGDSIDDMVAGHEAGALTVLLRSEGKEELEHDERTDVVISRLDELVTLIDNGIASRRSKSS